MGCTIEQVMGLLVRHLPSVPCALLSARRGLVMFVLSSAALVRLPLAKLSRVHEAAMCTVCIAASVVRHARGCVCGCAGRGPDARERPERRSAPQGRRRGHGADDRRLHDGGRARRSRRGDHAHHRHRQPARQGATPHETPELSSLPRSGTRLHTAERDDPLKL
eukprot:6200912-Pleurochrysis_carterae.AAC.1